ncbi:hypothetical protein ABPG77_004241 [Micractinium sp. CCAP 211/92]
MHWCQHPESGRPQSVQRDPAAVPADFPIRVDEEAGTVTVAAGIPQRMLLDYLADYRYGRQPAGWVLPAFSWWTDQTIGGAVATNSHGSTMRYGSLSSQVTGMTLVLANGTLLTATPKSHPHLFRALGVSVGRLGVVTELTLKIKPQMAVPKSLQQLTFAQFAGQIKSSQDKYNAAKARGNVEGMKQVLFEVDETQVLWIVESDTLWRTDFTHLEKEPSYVLLNVLPGLEPPVEAMSGPDASSGAIFDQKSKTPVRANPQMTSNPAYWGRFYATLGREYVTPGTWESRKSFLAMTEQGTRLTSTFAPYIQMEVAVPFEAAGDCLQGLAAQAYGPARLYKGFRNPALIRFVSGEEFYLSPNRGGPHLWVNLEDWISLSSGKPNDKFMAVMKYFRERCWARLHWGKGGWPQLASCFDGAKEYPNSWCHFGCAAQELDPRGKFAGAGRGKTDVWVWNATRAGQAVPLASCCTPEGFSSECQCASRGPCA